MSEVFSDILILLIVTNGAPIVVARLFQSHGALPVDLGRQLPDGRQLFGSAKTWRGVAAAVSASCIASIVLGYGFWFGLVFGALVMVGDLASSFVKRRRGLRPSARYIGLDQLPEAFFPSIYAVLALDFPWWWAVPLALTFMLLEVLVSWPLFWLKIRTHPY